jgi:hypothetical protein
LSSLFTIITLPKLFSCMVLQAARTFWSSFSEMIVKKSRGNQYNEWCLNDSFQVPPKCPHVLVQVLSRTG